MQEHPIIIPHISVLTEGQKHKIHSDSLRILSTVGVRMESNSIEIFNRKGELAFQLPGETRFGIGVTDLYYQSPENNSIIPFSRDHMALTVRLGERLTSYDAVCTTGIIHDVPVAWLDVYSILEMVSNTIKPFKQPSSTSGSWRFDGSR